MNDQDEIKVLLTLERMESKIDRMGDRVRITEKRVESLHDVVTGSESGAETGLIIRVHDLEQRLLQQEQAFERITSIDGRIDSMEDKLDQVLRMQEEHPPLLYLLRFKTRKTIFWIVFAFLLLSVWYISSFRQPILEFFGLPIF